MGILDIFKKKEDEQAGQMPQATPISQTLQMKERGLTNNQIIQVLQHQGYNPQQIYDALAQAEARQSIEPYAQQQEMPREELPENAPINQEPQQMQYPTHTSHSNEELVESIIQEKWERMQKEMSKIEEWKDKIETRIDKMEQKVTDIKSDLDGLQKAIVARVGEYDKTLSNVGTEIKAMEKVFKDVLPEMTSNIQELSRITKKMKGKETEEIEVEEDITEDEEEPEERTTKLESLTKR